MRRTALIVFARPPIAGQVKTRLTSLITPAEAATLYAAFLRDALDQYSSLEVDVHLHMSESYTLEGIPPGLSCYTQVPGDLGHKMTTAFSNTFSLGYNHAIIIGTDHPTLPDAYLRAAVHALESPPAITVGPTKDGGYYLLGMTQCFSELFRDMVYSQPDVFTQTLARARPLGARIVLLPTWYDVDDPKDLQYLAASTDLPRYTRSVMDALRPKYWP